MTARRIIYAIRTRLTSWLADLPPQVAIAVLAVIIGLATGIAAWLLKLMIATLSSWLTTGWSATHFNYRLLFLPLAGIVLAGLYQRYILRRNIEHGIERVKNKVKAGNDRVKPDMIYSPMLASTLTLGFGGSAGSEGPIATTGAAIGSNVGRMFGLTSDQLRILIGCGAGAGIAGIFKAPVGGMLFTLEVLALPLNTVSVIALLCSCIISSMTAYALSGYTYDINFIQSTPFDPHLLPWAILLGLLCGLYSAYYSTVMRRLRIRLEHINRPLLRNILAGASLAVMVFVFPTLYGEGYGSLSHLINGHQEVLVEHSLFYTSAPAPWLLIAIAAAILVCKPFAACTTNSGGGVAGDFAPTLFAGAIAGYLFAMLLNHTVGTTLPVGNCAFIGMAAVMAGAVRAPLMALFLTSEMADGYQFFIALLIATSVSYFVVRLLDRSRRHLTSTHKSEPVSTD